ncbi:xanthine dehydrogenase/oxidase-like [Anneissia japonica]|uniref:xanthine dehydrogenase/oxidase-like n=1 Tax=Anneissia japonica TaxID=1529436 RepID=UPI00142553E7|nr:xanthine dehydrogenase/oxidase-like [Anneissia japonica]
MDTFIFFCNGNKIIDPNVDNEETLLSYLRTKLRLTGSKWGCAEGGCGACTVMVSEYDPEHDEISHVSVNACLTPVCSLHLKAVTTIEGIGSTKTKLHPVQERIAKSHGSQCGFCTPGIVMSMYTLLRNNQLPSMEDIETTLQGNLCRCTGYRPILEGFKTFTKKNGCCKEQANGCCKSTVNSTGDLSEGNSSINGICSRLFEPESFTPYDATMDIIFPPELIMILKASKPQFLQFIGKRLKWLQPVTLQQVLDVKAEYPDVKFTVGNTEVGVEVKFKNSFYPIICSCTQVSEMNRLDVDAAGVRIGASVTLTRLYKFLQVQQQTLPVEKCKSFVAFLEMIHWFAGDQIRNVASIGGNIVTGSPISDLVPILMAARATIELVSTKGNRRIVKIDNEFYTGYRQNAMRADEVLSSVHIPFTNENEFIYAYKQAHRRDDDIAIVNAAMRVRFDSSHSKVTECSLAFGGMAATTKLALKTGKAVIGRAWNQSLLEDVCTCLADEMSLPPGAPGGMVEYRQSLTLSFFFKFYMTVKNHLAQFDCKSSKHSTTDNLVAFHRGEIMSTQLFQEVPSNRSPNDAVGRPIAHTSSFQQATGEAVYVDDMRSLQDELFMALVCSQHAHANIISVDFSKALALDGVHAYIDHKDVPGNNLIGVIVRDEEVFTKKEVTCCGQAIGGIVAKDRKTAQRAAKLVKIEYEDLETIVTIQQAINRQSYLGEPKIFQNGDIEEGFRKSEHILEGEMRVGEQEHFYLETNSCIVIPKGEKGEMEVYSATQSPSDVQHDVSRVLGVPSNRVVVKVKRVGGGFGGKETKAGLLAARAAVASHKLNRPIRCVLDRDEDMGSTGTRHAYLGRYKVGFSNDGRISALKLNLYSNGGNSVDLTFSVMFKSLSHADCCYNIPNRKITGYMCRTNIPSNTAFRGFGAPQSMMLMENIVNDVATFLKISHEKVREINMYEEGDYTHYMQKVENITLRRCWDECVQKSNYEHRKQKVVEFNRLNRWKKRGLYIIPTKFGIGFEARFLNQAGALVMVYTDGSVLLTHGGVEMGQGLHTKMTQVASRELGISIDKIHISETSTNTVPNTSPSAASTSSDLNGMAVRNACRAIRERLVPFKKDNPKGTWEDWVISAYKKGVSLSSTGYYENTKANYDFGNNKGQAYYYYTYGVGVSEVEIDCLTGDHQVLRTDIVMDVGDSLNPAIDIGQIEGAFIQGYGLFTLEEHRWSPSGRLLTKGPGFYKIPGFSDIPVEFNVSLLAGVPNDSAVCSSKAIGEPPLFLASSVFYAIKDAIASARSDAGVDGIFRLDSPATAEVIRMACVDEFTKPFPESEPGTFTPFFVRS